MAINFIKSLNASLGEDELLATLKTKLSEGKKLLWIVSGGSVIDIAARVMSNLDDNLSKNLQVLLSDERYGEVGHKDSNYAQLVAAGFNKKQAIFESVLVDGLTMEQTKARFTELFINGLVWADQVIGQLGIGEDGHIAGILPNSPVVSSTESVVAYDSNPYQRISLSLKSLKQIDQTLIFCFGQNKHDALSRLYKGKESLDSLPSMILNQISNVKVYNDQIEGDT